MSWNPIDDLSPSQREKLNAFAKELGRINKRINLVAPSTIPHAFERHLVHSLTLALRNFPDGSTVVDFGAGGGLPAVPLAIRFPQVKFVAIDSAGKKVEATRLFARRLELDNLEVWNGRAETWGGTAHYAVSRATAPLVDLWNWFERVRQPLGIAPDECWPPGLLSLKGGDLRVEISALKETNPKLTLHRTDLSELLGKPHFVNKEILAVSEPNV